MISRDQMFEPMLAVLPSFAPVWVRFCAEWPKGPKDWPLYIVLGDLALHLVERIQIGSTDEFPELFQVVEHWHCEGDNYVREAATIGLLENIQNTAGREGIDLRMFERWLLPESRKSWNQLNQFWDGGARLLQNE